MRGMGERGDGKIGSIIWLLIVVGVVWTCWQLIPVYYSNYNFQDRVTELARAPKYSHSDDRIYVELRKSAQENHLEAYINEQTCKVNTMDVRRTISCEYDRQVEVLP